MTSTLETMSTAGLRSSHFIVPESLYSGPRSLVTPIANGFDCTSRLEIAHSFHFVDDIFNQENPELAQKYKSYERCLAVVDHNVYDLHHTKISSYFKYHCISATLHRACVSEDTKDIDSMLGFCDQMTRFGLSRREPLLVVGGGLITDVAGLACAMYRRSTRYIRVPTTLVGLIDASVSNRVAVNWQGMKNRLGSYHEPLATFVDHTFLRTVPRAEVRNGIAELIKIFSTTHSEMYSLLERHGEMLIKTEFGLNDHPSKAVVQAAHKIIEQGIFSVLEVEIPNARETDLDRVMAFGHTWSPNLELAADPKLLHGHAISVDMAFSASLAFLLGLLTRESHARMIAHFSLLGLSLDHPAFTLDLLKEATQATTLTRNGLLRAPVPTGDLGTHTILANVEWKDLVRAWKLHKAYLQDLPRKGLGIEATVDVREKAAVHPTTDIEIVAEDPGMSRSSSENSVSDEGETGKSEVVYQSRGFGWYDDVATSTESNKMENKTPDIKIEPQEMEMEEEVEYQARGFGWYGD